MKKALAYYFNSWWLPVLVFACIACATAIAMLSPYKLTELVLGLLLDIAGLAFLGMIAAAFWNLIKRRWAKGCANAIFAFGIGKATMLAVGYLLVSFMFGPSEDGFGDNLTIPEGLEIAVPAQGPSGPMGIHIGKPSDAFQDMVRNAMAVPGKGDAAFTPALPSLRMASTNHNDTF